jgi:hypothetical protein
MSSRLPIVEAPPRAASPAWTRARARAWLRSAAVVDDLGAVRSWHNPRHPGFDYPEAAGLWLSAFAGPGTPTDHVADRVAARLAARVSTGEVGRDGVSYTFDLGVALAGLVDHRRAGGRDRGRACEPGEHELFAALTERRVVVAERPARWSTRYGPHMLKLAAVLARLPGAAARTATARLFDDLADMRDGGRFVTSPDGSTYVHAHCYAAEGLLCIARGEPDSVRGREATDRLAHAADWLADAQRPDGALPSHSGGARTPGPERTDATAQAIRIWAMVDAPRHATSIARARRFLAGCTAPEGALRYEPGSDDLNTWATIFGVQAGRLARAAAGGIPAAELPW